MYRKLALSIVLFLIFVAFAAFSGHSACAAAPAVTDGQVFDSASGGIDSASELDALISSSLQSLFEPGPWKAPYIQVDGRQIPMDAQPVLQGSSVWAPYYSLLSALELDAVPGVQITAINGCDMAEMANFCKALGYSYSYDAGTKRVMVATGAPVLSSGHSDTIAWDEGMYTGEIKAGVPDGQGTLTWDDGTVYTGDFRVGSMTGKGTLTCPEGFTYTGDFLDGLFNGNGLWTDSSGVSYDGQWLDGRQHGWGTMTYASGVKWQGTFENGYRVAGQFIQ